MKPREKLEVVMRWCDELRDFSIQHPEILDHLEFFFKNLPSMTGPTPFNRLKTIPGSCKALQKRFGAGILGRMYKAEWATVKTISYNTFFIEHYSMWGNYYDIQYKILGDDILFHDIYVPKDLIIDPILRNFYLKK